MTVYLWDAPGPAASWSGISGSLDGAWAAAGERLTSGDASSACVEAALPAMSAATMQPLYERTGTAWRARREEGAIEWEPIELAAARTQ